MAKAMERIEKEGERRGEEGEGERGEYWFFNAVLATAWLDYDGPLVVSRSSRCAWKSTAAAAAAAVQTMARHGNEHSGGDDEEDHTR